MPLPGLREGGPPLELFHGKLREDMVKSRLSSKGQITVPKPVREALGLAPGEEVVFELRQGEAVLRPRRRVPLEDLLGRLGGKRPFPGEEEETRAREAAWAREG
jgi:AbrB family looped-hinge helix DNA binding protein